MSQIRRLALCSLIVASVGVTAMCSPTAAPVVLRVWQTETDKDAVQVFQKEIIPPFESEFNVRVELESVAWSALSPKLSTALQNHNEPDLTHIEPFMFGSLISRDLLLPLDDVVGDIERASGDTIYKGVRDLQRVDGKVYGIAYAVGTTAFGYRKDKADELHLATPKTWPEYITFVKALHGKGLPLILPGGDPFFIDQLFAELVANNGGILFDPATRRPQLDSRQVVEVLALFRQLAPYVDPSWQSEPYLDQFNRFAQGKAGNVPVLYARAGRTIQQTIKEGTGAPGLKATPEFFAVMPQPLGPSGHGPSIATIDCEPFVIFRQAAERKENGRSHAELAKELLRRFYNPTSYLHFVGKVPIHLTPIFQKMSQSDDYKKLDYVRNWQAWADQTSAFLAEPSRLRPILMPDPTEQGKVLPFLLEFQASRILTEAVTDAIKTNRPVEQIASDAQLRAERLVTGLSYRKW